MSACLQRPQKINHTDKIFNGYFEISVFSKNDSYTKNGLMDRATSLTNHVSHPSTRTVANPREPGRRRLPHLSLLPCHGRYVPGHPGTSESPSDPDDWPLAR
jgi:hypothetical protein